MGNNVDISARVVKPIRRVLILKFNLGLLKFASFYLQRDTSFPVDLGLLNKFVLVFVLPLIALLILLHHNLLGGLLRGQRYILDMA